MLLRPDIWKPFEILRFHNFTKDMIIPKDIHIGFDKEVNCFNCKSNTMWFDEYDNRMSNNIEDVIYHILNKHPFGVEMNKPCIINKNESNYLLSILPICYKIKFNHLSLRIISNFRTHRDELQFVVKRSFDDYKIVTHFPCCCREEK